MYTPPSSTLDIASDMERWYTNHDDSESSLTNSPDYGLSSASHTDTTSALYPPPPHLGALGPPLTLMSEVDEPCDESLMDRSGVFELWEQVLDDASMGISAGKSLTATL